MEHSKMIKFLFIWSETGTEALNLPFLISKTARSNERNISMRPEKKGIKPEPGLVGRPNPNLIDATLTIIPTISQKRILNS